MNIKELREKYKIAAMLINAAIEAYHLAHPSEQPAILERIAKLEKDLDTLYDQIHEKKE